MLRNRTDSKRATLFDMPLDLLDMQETVARCAELVEDDEFHQHVVVNAGKVVLCSDSPELRATIADCEVVNADGQVIVWTGRLAGLYVPERVAGIDLMSQLLHRAEADGWPVYFLGATQEVLDSFLDVIQARYPKLRIAGARNGYFTGDTRVADAIAATGARLLFIAMPSPRKEYFAASMRDRLGPLLVVGVGGSFDVVAGLTGRAPVWMQRAGLEWFYRFAQEPHRLWRRYLIGNARFLWLATWEILRCRRR